MDELYQSKELLEVIDYLLNPLEQKEQAATTIDDIILYSRIKARVKRKLKEQSNVQAQSDR